MRLIPTRHLLPIAAAALVLSACGGSSDGSRASSTTAPAVGSSKHATFVLDEWSIVPPQGDLAAGQVAITARNKGSETHELVIVRASDAASLPKNADGSVDEERIPESKKAGEIADLAAGTSRTKTLDLPAGDYIAFCNIVEGMGNGTTGSGGMGHGSGMGTSTPMGMGGKGMHHVHFQLGMVNYFTVA